MIKRRSFFTRLGLLVGGLVTGPNLFLPKIEPVRWKAPYDAVLLQKNGIGCVKLPQSVQDELASVLPSPANFWNGLGEWNLQDIQLPNGLWKSEWRWTGPGDPPAAFPAYEGGPNPKRFLENRGLIYPPELPEIVEGCDVALIEKT